MYENSDKRLHPEVFQVVGRVTVLWFESLNVSAEPSE